MATKKKPKGVMKMSLTYTKVGDYELPNLSVPESPKIGKYGMLRHTFLRNHRKTEFSSLMLSGKMNSHLEEIDRQATEMMESLTKQMAQTEQVNEKLKATDQMKWVQLMNNIRNRAEEIVLAEVVYS